MIILIDNYDSFTYNLYQYIGIQNPDIMVVRNDKITIAEIEKLSPSHIVVSPGPKYPKDAGISVECIKYFGGKIPVLGICLGHQSIGEAYGGNVIRADNIMHGKASMIKVDTNSTMFKGLPDKIRAARYHSLVVEGKSLPTCLKVTASDYNGAIMALEHRDFKVYGLQFHPESVLTDYGMTLIKNFLDC